MAVGGNNPPVVVAGFELRLPKRLGCEVGAVLGTDRDEGLAWELFKLAKSEVMIVD